MEAVSRGDIKRLIINIPPRYGKTICAVQMFMPWCLANNPKARFMHLSFADSLVKDNSDAVRDTVKCDASRYLFPQCVVSPKTDSKEKWYTTQNGGLYAVSTGAPITGFGAGTFRSRVYSGTGSAADRVITMDEAREAIYRCMIKQDEGLKEKKFESRATQFIERFTDADGGKLEKLTGWNLYNAIQGAYQHGVKKTATYEKSLIMGRIAQQAEDSLKVVTDLLFEWGYSKTSTPEFDQLFARVA